MADPFGIVQSIISLLFTINEMVGTFHTNKEDCRRICTLVGTARAVVEPLNHTLNIMENKPMSAALKGLEEALKRSRKVVESCSGKKKTICSVIQAKDIAEDLRRVYEDILANLVVVGLANGINNTLTLADIRADLRAMDADADAPAADIKAPCASLSDGSAKSTPVNSSMLADILADLCARDADADAPAADSKGPCASSPDGTAKSTSVNGQGGPNIVNKARSSSSKLVDGVQSVAVSAAPSQLQEIISISGVSGETGSYKIIPRSIKNMTRVTSIDVHPTKPWIVTGHEEGIVSIWDYSKQQTVMEMPVTEVPGNFANIRHKWYQYVKETAAPHWVCSVKFITQEKWLAVGDGAGYIHVYTCTDTMLDEVKKFRADHGESVDLLAVHKTKTYLLSSSAYGRKINLWNWSRDWEHIREYDVKPRYPDGVVTLKFNPRDTNTFACVTDDKRLQVGNIEPFSLTTKLKGVKAADYFFTPSRQHLMVTLRSRSPDAEIRDLETGEIVHTLGVSGCKSSKTILVACHPRLPILVTALDDGTVCLWDARTYRLEKMVHITNSPACDLAFTDINDITRLVVTFESRIAIMEVNLPWANTGG